ncbi:MAG TPA: GNAT family N-acetyltransferase [Candidatus Limiplasma sp.]|nr:GNAT family N-acetyltransferase [Candidatus Limiplasma sp.]
MQADPQFDPMAVVTRRLVIRPARMRDARDMFEYSKDPQVALHVLWDAHRSIRETRAVLRNMIRDAHIGPPFSYVIELKDERRVIGTIGLMNYSSANRSAEIGYSLSRAYWNRGIMSEALIGMLKFCFEELGLNRIEAQHEVSNPASGAVMRHAGMRHEGTLHRRIYNKGKFHDMELYAILKEEFHAQ